MNREYPAAPMVGVGAVILREEAVLLVRRGRPPAYGKWSVPGGLVNLGERIEAAVKREIQEEAGLVVELHGVVGVVDRIIRDQEGRIKYHYILVDFLATPIEGMLRFGSDALDARWVPVEALPSYDTTEGLADMVQRAVALRNTLEKM